MNRAGVRDTPGEAGGDARLSEPQTHVERKYSYAYISEIVDKHKSRLLHYSRAPFPGDERSRRKNRDRTTRF